MPVDGRPRRAPDDQRPGGVHAGQRVLPRRDGGRRVLRRGRVLRARHRRRRRHRPGDGRVDRRRRAVDGRLAHGHQPVRRAVPLAGLHARAHASRTTGPTTTSRIPACSATPVGRCAARRAYEWHRAHGAVFGEKSGWERVDWYETNATGGDDARPAGWAGRYWSPAIGAEHRATRASRRPVRRVVVRQARGQRPGRRRVPASGSATTTSRAAIGDVTYTQALNARGGIESRLHRHPPRRTTSSSIVTGTAFGIARPGLAAHARRAAAAPTCASPTSPARPAASRCGGRVRATSCSRSPRPTSSDAAFPFMTAQEITVGDVPVRALRVTFVGELGWELYASSEYGATLWQTLWAAGREHGLVAGGYRAIESMRLEKGYRVWGSDLTAETTPYEAGLGFCVKLDKPGGFDGRDALRGAREHGLDPAAARDRARRSGSAVVLGSEPVRIGGEVVGRVTSGGFGYTLGASIAYAYLPIEAQAGHRRSRSTSSARGSAAWSLAEPLFDPTGDRVRGADEDCRSYHFGVAMTPTQRPRIGLTTYREQARVGRLGRAGRPAAGDATPTRPRCRRGGVLLPPAARRSTPPPRWTGCTACSLAGGADVDPARYGAAPRPAHRRAAARPRRVGARARRARRSTATCRCSPSAAACRCSTSRSAAPRAAPARRRRHRPALPGRRRARPARRRRSRPAAARRASSARRPRSPRTTTRPSTGSAPGWSPPAGPRTASSRPSSCPARSWVVGVQWHPEAHDGAGAVRRVRRARARAYAGSRGARHDRATSRRCGRGRSSRRCRCATPSR